MPIANLSDWRTLINTANIQLDMQRNASIGTSVSHLGSLYDIIGSATPSTNETCDNTHDANLLARGSSASGKKLRLLHLMQCSDGLLSETLTENQAAASQIMVVFDRLAQTAGLSGIVTGEQTTNLPGTLPARASNGVGVCAFLRYWTTIGASGTTFTCRVLGADNVEYTTPVQEIVANRNGAGILVPILWPAGVTGIKEVRGVNLVGSTGTAGNIGIVYAKPLIQFPLSRQADLTEDFCWTGMNPFPVIDDAACIGWAPFIRAANRPFLVNACLRFNYVSN